MDRNKPPETWITAAPQDTLTTRDELGFPIRPQPGTIPSRYHLYWAGTDEDGTVVGFYWAVVETLSGISEASAPLPGPKAHDYRYTSVRDSVFIFNVFEGTNTRQHAFYIYAVDNQGKADPTPARVIFFALDRYPPIPIIDVATAKGFVFHPDIVYNYNGIGPPPPPIETTVAIRDTFNRATRTSDIVPVGSQLNFGWHAELAVADNPVVRYKYKLDEAEFVPVPVSVTSAEYNTNDNNRVGPGLKIFTLRAIDQSGGSRTSPETTRRFSINMSPDTWFAGPDPNVPGFYITDRYANGQIKERYRTIPLTGQGTWSVPAFPGSYLHPDSVRVLPASRKSSKTFFELYTEYNPQLPSQPRHRIYVHTEGDTVHLNSWVLFHGGGFDPDSPYKLRLLLDLPGDPLGAGQSVVSTAGPANGSPIGLRFRVPVFLDSLGPISAFPQSQTIPLLEPALVPEHKIGCYQGMRESGRAYAILRSEDGNGAIDTRIDDPVAFVDSIEKNMPMHPARYALKDKVLTFYVNRAPYLLLDNPSWKPKKDSTYFQRSIPLTLNLVADDDPFNSTLQNSVGGYDPDVGLSLTYRFNVLLRGRRTGSSPPKDTIYTPPGLNRQVGANVNQDVNIPDFLAGTPETPQGTAEVRVEIELCDCRDCETTPGQGRCKRYPPIRVFIPALTGPSASPSSSRISSEGPGSSGITSRSRTP